MRRCAPKHTHTSPFLYSVPARTPARALRQQERKGSVTERRNFPTRALQEKFLALRKALSSAGLFASFFHGRNSSAGNNWWQVVLLRAFSGGVCVCMLVGNIYCVVCESWAEGAQQQGRLIKILAAAELLFIWFSNRDKSLQRKRCCSTQSTRTPLFTASHTIICVLRFCKSLTLNRFGEIDFRCDAAGRCGCERSSAPSAFIECCAANAQQ